MSEWTEPKTDWIATDYINLSDYQRIADNLNYLHELASSFYQSGYDEGHWETPSTYSNAGAVFLWDSASRVESDVVGLAQATFTVPDYEDLKHRAALGSMSWTYEDLNIIEQNMVRLKEMLDAQKANRARLAVELGGVQFG